MQRLDITYFSWLRLAVVVGGIFLLFFVRDILVLLFIVLILVAGLTPTVDRWAKLLTRPGAVTLVVILFIATLGLVSAALIPPLVAQMREFSNNLPTYFEALRADSQSEWVRSIATTLSDNINSLSSSLGNVGNVVFQQTLGVISGLVAVVTVLILTFYILLEDDGLGKIYRGFLPREWYESLTDTTQKISSKLGAWVRGMFYLMLAVGFGTTIGLLIIGSPYALTLGLWAAITEIIPVIGPFIGAIPGVAVNLAESPLQGFMSLIVYLIVQQLENNVLVPRIMAKAVGLNPIFVMVSILIGGKIYGLMGVLLAVPIAAIISVVAEDWHIFKGNFQKNS